ESGAVERGSTTVPRIHPLYVPIHVSPSGLSGIGSSGLNGRTVTARRLSRPGLTEPPPCPRHECPHSGRWCLQLSGQGMPSNSEEARPDNSKTHKLIHQRDGHPSASNTATGSR